MHILLVPTNRPSLLVSGGPGCVKRRRLPPQELWRPFLAIEPPHHRPDGLEVQLVVWITPYLRRVYIISWEADAAVAGSTEEAVSYVNQKDPWRIIGAIIVNCLRWLASVQWKIMNCQYKTTRQSVSQQEAECNECLLLRPRGCTRTLVGGYLLLRNPQRESPQDVRPCIGLVIGNANVTQGGHGGLATRMRTSVSSAAP